MQTNELATFAGIAALSAYWSWIFVNFSSAVVNPFPSDQWTFYLSLLVVGALCSGVSVFVISLFPLFFQRLFNSNFGLILLIIASPLSSVPALFSEFNHPLPIWLTYLLWISSHAICSSVLIKSGEQMMRLSTSVITRCVPVSFIVAALIYALINCLAPVWGIVTTALLLTVAIICCNLSGWQKRDQKQEQKHEPVQEQTNEQKPGRFSTLKLASSHFGEHLFFAPLTAIYSISFGIISCIALNLALQNDLIFVLICAIIASAIFLTLNTFATKKPLDIDRFKKLLLPLIVIALIPINYLPPLLQVPLLSLAVFGFTCFDALSWETILFEIKERSLNLFAYASTGLIVSFFSIALGWGIGLATIQLLPANLNNTVFAFITTMIILALVIELVSSKWEVVPDNVNVPFAQHRTVWRDKCLTIANKCNLTAQETNIFLFLAKGRNASYVQSVLFISGHTVKTHIYHIYKKLEVHSQQELIDLVEKTALPG
jgi:DNA-binding CsgD family transcriptional regulator